MNTVYGGEQLLSEVVVSLFDLLPGIDASKVKNTLSKIISKYEIRIAPENVIKSDIPEKIDIFIASKRVEGLSELTLEGYRRELNLFRKKVDKVVSEITAADIRVYLGELAGLKKSTIGKKLDVLRSFFGFLTAEEYIQRDPTKKVKTPKPDQRIPKALNIEELEMLREGCRTPRQRALLEVMYATGCRLSEVKELNRNDVNTQNMSSKVFGKGRKERTVYLSFRALYHLKKYLNTRTDNEEALFVTKIKPFRRMENKTIQDEIKAIAKNVGLEKKVHPHVLRHTFATLMLNNGADLSAIQALLGHSNPATTQIYSQLTENNKQEQHKKFLVQ